MSKDKDSIASCERLIQQILETYPDTQAIYLFGSWGTEYERPESDVDIAVLLPAPQAKKAGSLVLSDLHLALQAALDREVDLINLRQAPTVLQKEVVMAGRKIFCVPGTTVDEFELLVLALYQKLNEERAEILAEGLRSGRFYDL
ncbi:nucleotidyltransferase domain-containing protein [Nitrosomonas sp. Nm166]|uniref:type VII toxin-antitoxin system MntA family adenylyltransferase antitoxin n=1 Tax=Nitrosomonas sp. Nm166 TaxID=1881054 RepID=UPI00210D95BB|nr:nucleotidyltransferase domain-containing protein [Nitrosomonas sp. Nm166]